MLWAISATAFFEFFRLGELLPDSTSFDPAVHLAWGDVAVDSNINPCMVQIHLKRSKCDLCLVSALLDYIACRGEAPSSACRGDTPGPFFRTASGELVTKHWFVSQLCGILAAIGLPDHKYAGHSFRIGAATTAALVGIEDSTIQALGRWHSAAFLEYFRMPKERLASLSSRLARQTQPTNSQ